MLEVRSLSKSYPTADGDLEILRDIELSLSAGDSASIMGPSGGGKSTLLFILGALEPPSSGEVLIDGADPSSLSEPELARFRNDHIGFVFQDHHLLPQCTVLENVLTPTLVAPRGDYEPRALELLDRVGLIERLGHFPGQLSGGEKQRVAIARSLMRSPKLILCDEPTGNLDERNADRVADQLFALHGASGDEHARALICVTHNAELAKRFPIQLDLNQGRLTRKT